MSQSKNALPSKALAAHMVVLALRHECGLDLSTLKEQMQAAVDPADEEMLKKIGKITRFNISESEIKDVLEILTPILVQIVRERRVRFDLLAAQYYYVLHPEALPQDQVPYLNPKLVHELWNDDRIFNDILSRYQGMWRLFRISTPTGNDVLTESFYDTDFDIDRSLLVIKHGRKVKEEGGLPEFSLYQRVGKPTDQHKYKRINGMLLPVSDRLYLMGHASDTYAKQSFVSTLMWMMDGMRKAGELDGLGLLTNSSFEQIAVPIVGRRVKGSEEFQKDSKQFEELRADELKEVGKKSASSHGSVLSQEDKNLLIALNKRVVLRVS